MSFDELLAGKRVCVCAGPGGVGKTTMAAALALGMAARGSRVAVVTIDPARRLAGAMGLELLEGEERRVHVDGLSGELWAMTLDPKATWDDLVRRHTSDPRRVEAILSNRIYRELSTAVAGTQEFSAVERLHELHDSRRYDLVVLDTPPSRNALDFLDAPGRVSRLLGSTALRAALAPGRILGRGSGMALGLLGRVTGVELLRELTEFFTAFAHMSGGLQKRAEQVAELLSSDETTFVVVATPEREPVQEAVFLHRRLRSSGFPFGAAVVNRVHGEPAPGVEPETVRAELTAPLGSAVACKVAEALRDQRVLGARDRAYIARLEEELAGEPFVLVPRLEDDVHDLDGLRRVGGHLFAVR